MALGSGRPSGATPTIAGRLAARVRSGWRAVGPSPSHSTAVSRASADQTSPSWPNRGGPVALVDALIVVANGTVLLTAVIGLAGLVLGGTESPLWALTLGSVYAWATTPGVGLIELLAYVTVAIVILGPAWHSRRDRDEQEDDPTRAVAAQETRSTTAPAGVGTIPGQSAAANGGANRSRPASRSEPPRPTTAGRPLETPDGQGTLSTEFRRPPGMRSTDSAPAPAASSPGPVHPADRVAAAIGDARTRVDAVAAGMAPATDPQEVESALARLATSTERAGSGVDAVRTALATGDQRLPEIVSLARERERTLETAFEQVEG